MLKEKHDLYQNRTFYVLIFFFLILLTRLLFKSHYLYEWDSVHYALAIEKLDILWHQPHPPGYILYVFLLKISALIFENPINAIIMTNIFLSLFTLALTYSLTSKIFNQKTAVFACFVMTVNPLFWFYGCVPEIYISEAFVSILIGYMCWSIFFEKKYLYICSFLFGLCGGFRQTILLLLFPLFIFSVFNHTKRIRKLFCVSIFVLLGVLIWLLPTFSFSGGFAGYRASSQGLFQGGLSKVHLFFGGFIKYYEVNILNILIWSFYLLGLFGLLLLPIYSIKFLKSMRLTNGFRKKIFQYFGVWIIPPFLFYIAIFIDKPGYLLILMSPISILIGHSLYSIKNPLLPKKSFIFILLTTLSFIWFIFPWKNENTIKRIEFPETMFPKPPLSHYAWDISKREIKYVDSYLETIINLFKTETLDNDVKINSENSVIIYRDGFPNWRQISFYLPDYLSLWIIDKENSGLQDFGAEAYFTQNGDVWSASGYPFWVEGERPNELEIYFDPKIQYIFWFVSEKSAFYKELKKKNFLSNEIILDNFDSKIPYTTIKPGDIIDVSVFKFRINN